MNRACKECHLLSDEPLCPVCAVPTSKNWSGMLTIVDPAESELAEVMKIERAGTYALKVR